MGTLKLLFVEDDAGDRDTFRSSVKVYQAKNSSLTIEVVEVPGVSEAEQTLNNSFDAAVIDLRLGADPDAGEKIIKQIRDKWRIPVAVLTGTPVHLEDRHGLIDVYIKGVQEHSVILDRFKSVWSTGLTRVFGGRGVIETEMAKIFWESVLPNLSAWERYASEGKDTEAAILRFALNHLMESLQTDVAYHFAEETYITSVLTPMVTASSKQLRTGAIVREKADAQRHFFVITPACDLVVRGNSLKTDRILLCEIDSFDSHYTITGVRKLFKDGSTGELSDEQSNGLASVRKLCSNTQGNNLHFLPPTSKFAGGLINFRKLLSFKPSDFDKAFHVPALQVSPFFTKDVVSRFSSYYARQGQPDLYFDELASKLVGAENLGKSPQN